MTDTATVLRALGRTPQSRRATKFFFRGHDGRVQKSPEPKATYFAVQEAPISGLADLHALLLTLERDPEAFIVRGQPTELTVMERARRLKVGSIAKLKEGQEATPSDAGSFAEVPRHWVMLDLDSLAIPGASVTHEPHHTAAQLLDMIGELVPDLASVSAVVQFSSSAGLAERVEADTANGIPSMWSGVAKGAGVVPAHIWYWLADPVGELELKRWAAAVGAACGRRGLIDPATLHTVQPHYTAAPIFEAGLPDPVPTARTLLIEGESDAARLTIPAEPERPAYTPGQRRSSESRGYLGWLAAIGDRDAGEGFAGFHAPITSAIAAYVATNWPEPDADQLKADIRETVLAAPPGARSAGDVARYASADFLDGIIDWVAKKEAASRAAKAAAWEAEQAEARANALQPTYPDRGIPVAEVPAVSREALASFTAGVAAGQLPRLLLNMTVGGGKTFSAIDYLPELLAAGRAAGAGPVLFLHPRHALGDQIAGDIKEAHPRLKVAIIRGMGADDPANPGKAMCQDLELSGAARAAGLAATDACGICPLKGACGYQRQRAEAKGADVYVAAHQAGYSAPFDAWPREVGDSGKRKPMRPSAVIVDEGCIAAGLEGVDDNNPILLALSSLQSTETPGVKGGERERLIWFREHVHAALAGLPAGGVSREAAEWLEQETGEGVPFFKEWADLEWMTKPKVKLGKGTTRAEAMAAFEAAQEHRFNRLLPKLGKRIGQFLATGDARSIGLSFIPDATFRGGEGSGPAIRFERRRDFHDDWLAPTLFLDATGRAEVLQHLAPDVTEVSIEVSAPHQHVTQIIGQEFSQKMLTMPGNLASVLDYITGRLALAKGEVLVICQAAVERLLRKGLEEKRGAVRDLRAEGVAEDAPATYRFPNGAVLHTAHHGAVTGSNAWAHVAGVIVLGRPALSPDAGERLAAVIGGKAVDALPECGGWWPTRTSAIRLADGTGFPVPNQPYHPDPLVEAVRWGVAEGAAIQAIGRVRGVRRTADNPVWVDLFASMALPLTVERVATFDEIRPAPIDAAMARAILLQETLPLSARGLAAARGDLWKTPEAAKQGVRRAKGVGLLIRDLYKQTDTLSPPAPPFARFKQEGAKRWSWAVVQPIGGKPAVAALVGPLVAYEGSEPEAPEPVAPAAAAPTRQDTSATGGNALGFSPFPPPAEPFPADLDSPGLPPLLHPLLPGETIGTSAPRPAQPGLLGVMPGRAPPTDEPPEPGSFEPEDDPDAVPVDERGMPLEAPAEWVAPWAVEMDRRLAPWPWPDMSCGWPKAQMLAAVWMAETEPTRSAVLAECHAAWRIARAAKSPRRGEGS